MAVLHVPAFRGIVLEGSSDAERADELLACDGYELGPRGQLVAASRFTAGAANVSYSGTPLPRLYGVAMLPGSQDPRLVVAGDTGSGGLSVFGDYQPASGPAVAVATSGTAPASGCNATIVTFPYVVPSGWPTIPGTQTRTALVCFGARYGQDPSVAPGLYVFIYDGSVYAGYPISRFDALGTGTGGVVSGGTKSKQLKPRGIVGYHGHILAWGYDADATSGDGPNRVMFSNIGNPLAWGEDALASDNANYHVTDRTFADNDAVEIGGAGEGVRAGYAWAGKCWFATRTGLFYLEGFGRESFKTNGALPVRQTAGAIGPHALIEGPDGLLHGVDDTGHWLFDGSETLRAGNVLRDYAGHSIGYWDLIWTSTTNNGSGYPGTTNQDLVWMLSDPETQQVWIVIPWCNASAGYGYGTDTVVLKYHVKTGGYTRQIFTGQILTAGMLVSAEGSVGKQRVVLAPGTSPNVQQYAAKATALSSPALPTTLPSVTVGEYAPFGPDGVGTLSKADLVLSWESALALPLVFTVTATVDGEALGVVKVSVQSTAPTSPSSGDVWVDTSGSDTNLGNGTAGAIVPAHAGDFLVRRYVAGWSKWVTVGGGQQGTRATIALAFTPTRGTRLKLAIVCTAASGRYQIEGVAFSPRKVREAV